jgi:hypothetical protein
MKRDPVQSTTMRSVGYEAKSKVLEIEFESGVVYQYLEVPGAVVEALRRAESRGRYFNQEIREDYECVLVGARQRTGKAKKRAAAADRLQWSSAICGNAVLPTRTCAILT